MREIEAEAVFGNQRTLLRDMIAEAIAQRCMDKVRRGMVRPDPVAPFGINFQMDRVADLDRTAGNPADMRVQPAQRLVGGLDCEFEAFGRPYPPGIPGLATAFAIERRLVGQNDHLVTGPGRIDLRAVLDDRNDLGFASGRIVARELGRSLRIGDIEPDLFAGRLARTLPRRPGSRLLLLHRRVESALVDGDAAAAQRIFRQIVGEAIGVVELERGLPVQRPALAHRAGRLVEQLEALVERAAELRFLAFEHLFDQRLPALQFGIGLTHLGDESGHETVHQRFARAEQVCMAHGTAHDPPQDIAAAFVRRQNAIGHQEAGRAQMVGDDPVAGSAVAFGLHSGQPLARRDQIPESVGVVIVVHPLHHRGDAFDPHARVDARLGQVADDLVVFLRELHEHEIPNLDKAVAVLLG